MHMLYTRPPSAHGKILYRLSGITDTIIYCQPLSHSQAVSHTNTICCGICPDSQSPITLNCNWTISWRRQCFIPCVFYTLDGGHTGICILIEQRSMNFHAKCHITMQSRYILSYLLARKVGAHLGPQTARVVNATIWHGVHEFPRNVSGIIILLP